MTGATDQRGPVAPLTGLLAVVALATVLLHAAGRGDLSPPPLTQPTEWEPWLSQRDPLVAAMALLRLVALGTGWYVLATAGLGLLLRLLRAGRLLCVADKLTLPAVRRLLVSAAGMTLASAVSPSFGPVSGLQLPAAAARLAPSHAAAAGDPVTTTTTLPTVTQADERERPPPTLTMRLLPADGPAPVSGPPPSTVEEKPIEVIDAATWRVEPGECFWSIAEDVLARTWGRPPSDGELVPYWEALIELNRGALADKTNPDLVFPAQVFTLPAVPALPDA